MFQRYAHLSPGHLVAAVEKIVVVPAQTTVELGQNLDLEKVASKPRGAQN
jgi:hypothetical protein